MLFCVLDVWLDFIRVVVLPLFSRGINFHCNKHITNYTQDGLVNLRSTYLVDSFTCWFVCVFPY